MCGMDVRVATTYRSITPTSDRLVAAREERASGGFVGAEVFRTQNQDSGPYYWYCLECGQFSRQGRGSTTTRTAAESHDTQAHPGRRQ